MSNGPPLPLPPEFPLWQMIPLIHDREQVGAWVRDSGPCHRLTITAGGRCAAVLLGQDLGELLRSCSHIILRVESALTLVPAGTLIRWRVLEILTGTHEAPATECLQDLFPGCQIEPAGFRVPTAGHSPEEILADCVQHGIPVRESRVVYQGSQLPAPSSR